MRLNSKESLYESFQSKLKESNYYYKEFSGAGEIDYIEFDDEMEAQNYAEKVNKETGNETAVYKMSNDECVAVFDAKEKTECAEPKKVDLKEVFKASRHKRITESVQGIARVIWGQDVIADEEHMGEDYELFSIICNNIEDAEDEYNDGKISKKEFIDKIKIQCREGQLNDEETKSVIDFYEKSYSDSPEDMSADDSFTMYNEDTGKEVKVWKQDGKWYDDEGNHYMGYLSKQDVKAYFKRGNWHEV